MRISVEEKRYRLNMLFTISRGTRSYAAVLEVMIEDGGFYGYGECVPYARYNETVDGVRKKILSLKPPFDRTELQSLLPAGAARNGVDCALWDLESKQTGQPVWQIAGLATPLPLDVSYTISLATPEVMKVDATAHSDHPLLKIKLGGGQEDLERITAVREGAPDAKLIVDANEGWSNDEFANLAPSLHRIGVEMVEQPLPSGADRDLVNKQCPIPVCADESCHDVKSFEELAEGYSVINIKLDKTGGLTEALKLKQLALNRGYKIMTGCMLGSSLSMAPATLVAQGAEITDLDGPLLLAEDHEFPLCYENGKVYPANQDLWGYPK